MTSFESILLKVKERADQFASRLTDLNNANNELKNQTDKVLKKLLEFKGKQPKNCSVCYSREVSHALVPCGHCYCENDSSRALTRNRCPMCRAPVESILRVFIS